MTNPFSKLLFRLRRSRRAILLGAVLAVLIAVGGFFLIRAALDPYDCRILEGVSIAGLDVGGMTRGEARKALKSALEETLYRESLTVHLPEETISLSPEVSGVQVSVSQAVNAAYRVGRDDAADSGEIPLLPYLKVEEEAIRALLTEYAGRYDTELSQPSWHLEGTVPELSTENFDPNTPMQQLVVTLGTAAIHLDVDAVYGSILAEYDRCISDCRAGTFAVTPEVTPEAVPDAPDLEAIYAECAIPAVDDSLDMQVWKFVPGSYGCAFDVKAAEAQISAADWGETISFSLEAAEPEILGDEVYFRDVLGSCDTPHSSNENRNTNLRLVCQLLDGLILQPGEEFSYNGAVGERTPERGFQPAPAYSGTRLIQDYGGGVCQGSTTLYNCVLLADLEVTARVCHGAKVNYVPLGLDAAVNWATDTDLKFRNNFHFPIMLKAEVSDGYVKMQILGTDEKDYYVRMTSSSGDDEYAIYAVSYKCKYDKETDELISKEVEARSTYYKSIS